MQLYLIADTEGHLEDDRVLKCGKTIQVAGSKDDPLAKFKGSVHTSPLVAVLTFPEMLDTHNSKMFSVNRWRVDVDSTNPQTYTVVKEVPVPVVTLGQKVAFAVATVKEIFHDAEFVKWAEDWLSGKDRSEQAAKKCRESMEKEIQAAKDCEALAAWGVSGSDDQDDLKRQEDLEQRAVYAIHAAERFAASNGGAANEIVVSIKQSMSRIGQYGKEVNLATIAEHVLDLG